MIGAKKWSPSRAQQSSEQKRQRLKFRAAKGLKCVGNNTRGQRTTKMSSQKSAREFPADPRLGTGMYISGQNSTRPHRERLLLGCVLNEGTRKQLSAGRLWSSLEFQPLPGSLSLLRRQEGHVIAGSIMPSSVGHFLEQRLAKLFTSLDSKYFRLISHMISFPTFQYCQCSMKTATDNMQIMSIVVFL